MQFPQNVVNLPDCQQNWDFLRKLLDGSSPSSLVSTLSVLGAKLSFGTGVWTWPAASTISNITAITHGLGKAPVFVGAFAAADQGAAEVLAGFATTITLTGFSSRGAFKALIPGAGATANFYWIAIG